MTAETPRLLQRQLLKRNIEYAAQVACLPDHLGDGYTDFSRWFPCSVLCRRDFLTVCHPRRIGEVQGEDRIHLLGLEYEVLWRGRVHQQIDVMELPVRAGRTVQRRYLHFYSPDERRDETFRIDGEADLLLYLTPTVERLFARSEVSGDGYVEFSGPGLFLMRASLNEESDFAGSIAVKDPAMEAPVPQTTPVSLALQDGPSG